MNYIIICHIMSKNIYQINWSKVQVLFQIDMQYFKNDWHIEYLKLVMDLTIFMTKLSM